jgi:hypothetical protein
MKLLVILIVLMTFFVSYKCCSTKYKYTITIPTNPETKFSFNDASERKVKGKIELKTARPFSFVIIDSNHSALSSISCRYNGESLRCSRSKGWKSISTSYINLGRQSSSVSFKLHVCTNDFPRSTPLHLQAAVGNSINSVGGNETSAFNNVIEKVQCNAASRLFAIPYYLSIIIIFTALIY